MSGAHSTWRLEWLRTTGMWVATRPYQGLDGSWWHAARWDGALIGLQPVDGRWVFMDQSQTVNSWCDMLTLCTGHPYAGREPSPWIQACLQAGFIYDDWPPSPGVPELGNAMTWFRGERYLLVANTCTIVDRRFDKHTLEDLTAGKCGVEPAASSCRSGFVSMREMPATFSGRTVQRSLW